MMPIFFHVKAHLAILYALFLNGLLAAVLLSLISDSFKALISRVESLIICAFALSLTINSLVLILLDNLDQPFSMGGYFLGVLTTVQVSLLFLFRDSISIRVRTEWPLVLLYGFLFVILFYNGGLIDQVSDAWWHMSLANKIGWEGSYTLQQGHLTGLVDRYYPPLWHGNLALLRELSGHGLPALWNAFTPWGSVLKTMAFFLVGLSLFNNRKIASLGALLFVLLPGLGNSYMRVSAWPSHVSYVLWFYALYLTFLFFDRLSGEFKTTSQLKIVIENYVLIALISLLCLLIYFVHRFELLLLFFSVFLYLLSTSLYRVFVGASKELVDSTSLFLSLSYRLSLVLVLVFVSLTAIQFTNRDGSIDVYLVFFLPILILLALIAIELFGRSYFCLARVLIAVASVLLLLSVNYQHFMSLFLPELALPRSATYEKPLVALGWFGEQLKIPGWHLQLRAGLLWSGFVSLFASVLMSILKPSRAWLFLAANSVFAWLLILSPYLYHWFSVVLDYISVWRFAMLSFHPLIVAGLIFYLAKPFFEFAVDRGKSS